MALVEILVAGLVLGGMYALVAMGLTLQYGVARIMNLAYGEMLVASAFVAWFVVARLALPPPVALAVAVPAGFAVSWLLYRLMLTPLVRRSGAGPRLEVDGILATFGLLFVVQGVMLAAFGGGYYSYEYLSVPVDIFGTKVAANRLVALAIAVIAGLALWLALTRTRIGTAIRAVAVAPRFAPLCAIDVQAVSALAFALGGALVAAGGALVSMFLPFSAGMGVVFTMKALVVVIMGGVGDLRGCLVAGLLLGFAETIVARYVDPGLTLATSYALFLAVLFVRPTGLFGKPVR
jgi:branched-chain amino acid transport system permease protein